MERSDQDFINYVLTVSPDDEHTKWLKHKMCEYKSSPKCKWCMSDDVCYHVSVKAVIKCGDCNEFTEINIDKIPSTEYNAVNILQKDILEKILASQETT